MKQQYRIINFRRDSLERIDKINEILSEYDQKLTARQVYYQFVARGWLANSEKTYKLVTGLLADARYAGCVDWDAIEDRGREVASWSEWSSIEDRVDEALTLFRLPRWQDQDYYVELWVEKQALAGVLEPIAMKWHVPLMVNKGYSSASAMKDSAERMIERSGTRETVVLYLGDHDPSGEDMVRDVEERLREFEVYDLIVKKVALTMEQIKRWNPPPNPTKLSDARAAGYIAKYGHSSWELDALPPRELNRLVENAIRKFCDEDKYKAVIEKENRERARVQKLIRKTREEG